MVTPRDVSADDRMRYARVLVQIGEPYDAEIQLARVLEERPDDLGALDLLAKIKHIRGELRDRRGGGARGRDAAPPAGDLVTCRARPGARRSSSCPT